MESSKKKIPSNGTKDAFENVKDAKDALKIVGDTEGATKKMEETLPREPRDRPKIMKKARVNKFKTTNDTGNTFINVKDEKNTLEIVKDADGATKNAENKPINVKEDEVTLEIVKDADGETKNAENKPINMKEDEVTLEIMKDANGETKNTGNVFRNVKEAKNTLEIMKDADNTTKVTKEACINMEEVKSALEIVEDADDVYKVTKKVFTNVKEARDALEIMKDTYGATKIREQALPRKSSNRKELVKNDLAANNLTIKYSTKPSRLQEILRALRKERKIPKIIPLAEIQQDVDKPINHRDEIIKPKVGSTIVKLKNLELPKMSDIKTKNLKRTKIEEANCIGTLRNIIKIENTNAGKIKFEPAKVSDKTNLKETTSAETKNNGIKIENTDAGEIKTEPAEVSSQPRNHKKRRKKTMRIKETLPCNLNKRYILKAGTLSNKDFYEQCTSRRVKCKNEIKCTVHEGRDYLRKIRTLLKKINPNHQGWKMGIKWNIKVGGAMENLVNFKHLKEELIKTKEKVKNFNKSRLQLQIYKETINQLLEKAKENPSQTTYKLRKTKPGISKRNPKKKKPNLQYKNPPKNIKRLLRKLWENEQKKDPYSDEEENEIFLQMFRNMEIRSYCANPIEYTKISLQKHVEISATLNSFREMYTGFYRWSNSKFLSKLTAKWKNVKTIQKEHVTKLFNANEAKIREAENANKLNKNKVEIIQSDHEESEETFNPLYTNQDPEPTNIKTDPWFNKDCNGKPLEVKSLRMNMNRGIRVGGNRGYNFNSAYYDKTIGRWVGDEDITHPYIDIKMVEINPKSLKESSRTIDMKAMADTGAQCSIFTFEAVRAMGIEPEKLKESDVSIIGVGGKPLEEIVREICVKLTNKKIGTQSHEKIYVSPEVDKSILSKDTLYRLEALDPDLFLNEPDDENEYSVNNISEEIDKRSDCEKSMEKDKDGNIKCKCQKRTLPPDFSQKKWEILYDDLIKKYGEDSGAAEEFLREYFMGSAMNICKTQPLNKMRVTPMTVELKSERADRHPLKTTRIIPVPLPLQEAALEQIQNDVNIGILENVTNMANHDLWLSPMLIVPKKDNLPRRVVDFSNLNKLCKRNAETTSDTNRMATSVPTPKTGEKLFFSSMDAWNGYHSVPLEESAKKYFGFLTQWGTYRYKVVPQGFIGSGDHYVSVYNNIMNQLKENEKVNPNSVFRCVSDTKKQ